MHTMVHYSKARKARWRSCNWQSKADCWVKHLFTCTSDHDYAITVFTVWTPLEAEVFYTLQLFAGNMVRKSAAILGSGPFILLMHSIAFDCRCLQSESPSTDAARAAGQPQHGTSCSSSPSYCLHVPAL